MKCAVSVEELEEERSSCLAIYFASRSRHGKAISRAWVGLGVHFCQLVLVVVDEGEAVKFANIFLASSSRL